MVKMRYEMVVIGYVERRVTGEGNSLAECEENAKSEWAALVGGHIGTAHVVSSTVTLEEDETYTTQGDYGS